MEEFDSEVQSWLPVLLEVRLPVLTGVDLVGVVRRPEPWFDQLARILVVVEEVGIWSEGLLDAHFALIPEVGRGAAPLGQRTLCVLPIVYSMWASARMVQLEDWIKSWVPDSVSVLVGVGAPLKPGVPLPLTLKRCLLVLFLLMCMYSWLMWMKSLIRLIEGFWIGFLVVWGCLFGFDPLIFSIMLMFGCVSS